MESASPLGPSKAFPMGTEIGVECRENFTLSYKLFGFHILRSNFVVGNFLHKLEH